MTGDIMEMEGIRELGLERVNTLRHNSVGAQSESMQPPNCAEFWELLALPWSTCHLFQDGRGFWRRQACTRGALCLVGALVLVVLLLGFTLGVGRGGGVAFGGRVGRGGSGGLGLACNFRFALPVPGVDGLHESVVTIKGVGLANMGNFVLDAVRETTVEDVVEGAITVAADLASEAVELYHVLVYLLSFFHGQVVQLMFGISNRVMQAKVGLQFGDKLGVVVHP